MLNAIVMSVFQLAVSFVVLLPITFKCQFRHVFFHLFLEKSVFLRTCPLFFKCLQPFFNTKLFVLIFILFFYPKFKPNTLVALVFQLAAYYIVLAITFKSDQVQQNKHSIQIYIWAYWVQLGRCVLLMIKNIIWISLDYFELYMMAILNRIYVNKRT